MLRSPTVIITGASTGIGYALALVLAQNGYDLGLLARRLPLLQELKEKIEKGAPQSKIFIVECDVTDDIQCRDAVGELSRQLGRLDLFIANAGIGIETPAWKDSWGDIKKIMAVNVMGAIGSLEIAKNIMLQQGSGHLVGLSSVAAVRGFPQSSAYCASKAALTSYLESIRLDLKSYGIRVTSIHPGYINTPMTEKNHSLPFVISASTAAELIFKAIQSQKSRVLIPWQMKIFYPFLKYLPNGLYDFIFTRRRKKGVFNKNKN